jgi:hypothetical protein
VRVGRPGDLERALSILGVGASSMELRLVERRLCVCELPETDQGTRFKTKIVRYPPPLAALHATCTILLSLVS